MPDYKRKKVRKSLKSKPRQITNSKQDIVMSNSKRKKGNVLPENDIKIVRGAKLKRKRRINTLLAVTAIVITACIFLSLVLPVSLYENIVNTVAMFGHGSYPADISGTDVLNTVSNGSYYYVLSDTHISAYTNAGKAIFTEMHGFSNPMMSVSDARVLVFDQGGKNVYVYNLSGQIYSLETKNDIINANISRSGNFAVVTHSDNYTSSVNVYDKNCKSIYTWNSAKDIVNNVLVNPKGDKIAVSTLNAVAGQYDANVMVLNYESADALYTLKLDSSVALSLVNSGKGFSVITSNKYHFIHWSKFTNSEFSVSGEINIYRKSKNGILLVSNRANDRSDNTVIFVSNSGEKTSEFKINSSITDIQHSKGRIYYISDTVVNILDKNGTLLRYGSCGYGSTKFSVISAHSLAVITDNQIIKTEIDKGE